MTADNHYQNLQFKDRNVYSDVVVQAADKQKSEARDIDTMQRKLHRWRITALMCILLILLIIALGVVFFVLNFKKTKIRSADLQQLKADVCIEGEAPCTYCAREWMYYSGSCYFLSTTLMNWTKSQANCKRLKSTLVVVNSKEEEKFIEHTVQYLTWIGLSRDETRKFVWEDKSPFREDISFWWKDEPNDLRNDEGCVEVSSSASGNRSGWNDESCSSQRHSLCERPAARLRA